MASAVSKVKYTEHNNHMQGRSGAKVKMVSGPAVGNASGNKTNGGGVMSPTKGKTRGRVR